jgi:hypothetical protein
MSDATDKAPGFINDLGEAARRNPLSAALIGMGVLWLFADGKFAGRAGDLMTRTGLDRIPETTTNTWAGLSSSVSASAEGLKDAAGTAFDTMEKRRRDAAEYAADLAEMMPDPGTIFEAARENLTDLFHAQPLALGAIGLAIGAGLAAALPGTNVEDTYLGEVSETVRTKTAEIGAHQMENATTIATRVIGAAADEAHKQGLTLEGVKSAAGDVSDRMGRVIDAARSDASDRAG